MAFLKLDVLTFSAQVNATDENAVRILQAMLRRHGYFTDPLTGDEIILTGQEQVNGIIEIVTKFIEDSAAAQEFDDAVENARIAVLETPPNWTA